MRCRLGDGSCSQWAELGLQELPRAAKLYHNKLQAPSPNASAVRPASPASPASPSVLTIHAPGRWLVLRLLLRAAPLHTASLPLALSLREPSCLGGYLGDAVGHLLPQFVPNLHRALFAEPLFAAAVAGCASPPCVIAPRPELEKAWLFG
jgi:hypothetical protein